MSSEPVRNFTRLVVAIVVAAIVISAAVLSYSSLEATVTKTVTTTVNQAAASELYQVEFKQESNCPYDSWLAPWAVVVDNQTIVQPSNATLPLSSSTFHFTDDSNYSTISFSLPNGTYSYAVLPIDSLGSAQSGNITVDGSDVTVQVYAFITAMGCSSTTSG